MKYQIIIYIFNTNNLILCFFSYLAYVDTGDWIVGYTVCKCRLQVLSATKLKVTKLFPFISIIFDFKCNNLCVFQLVFGRLM